MHRALAKRQLLLARAIDDPLVFKGITGPRLAKRLKGMSIIGTGRKGKYFLADAQAERLVAFTFRHERFFTFLPAS